VDRAQKDLDVLAVFAGLQDMAREDFRDIYFTAGDGCTQTIIIPEPPQSLPDAGSGSEHILHVLDPELPRPEYVVDLIYGSVITLAVAMAEPAPAQGTACILVAKKKKLPRASDFPNQSIGFRVGGKWYVVDRTTGGIYRALEGDDLAKITAGTEALDLKVGWADGNANIVTTHKRRGRWDDGAITGALTAAARAQLRRGTAAQQAAFTGAAGEVTYDTDRKILVAGDGSTAGGEPVAKLAQFSAVEHDTGARLAGDPVYERSFVLDLTAQVDGAGNIGLYATPHLIAGLVLNDIQQPVFVEASWHLGAAAVISGAYASVPLLGSTYMVVIDPGNINVAVTGHGLGALWLFLRLTYCR
jgi:hypothetical protein